MLDTATAVAIHVGLPAAIGAVFLAAGTALRRYGRRHERRTRARPNYPAG